MRRLPERFILERDMTNECDTCGKVRKLCRDCGNCRECCQCPDPCDVCGRYRADAVHGDPDPCDCRWCERGRHKVLADLWDYEYECCEACAKKAGQVIGGHDELPKR